MKNQANNLSGLFNNAEENIMIAELNNKERGKAKSLSAIYLQSVSMQEGRTYLKELEKYVGRLAKDINKDIDFSVLS